MPHSDSVPSCSRATSFPLSVLCEKEKGCASYVHFKQFRTSLMLRHCIKSRSTNSYTKMSEHTTQQKAFCSPCSGTIQTECGHQPNERKRITVNLFLYPKDSKVGGNNSKITPDEKVHKWRKMFSELPKGVREQKMCF